MFTLLVAINFLFLAIQTFGAILAETTPYTFLLQASIVDTVCPLCIPPCTITQAPLVLLWVAVKVRCQLLSTINCLSVVLQFLCFVLAQACAKIGVNLCFLSANVSHGTYRGFVFLLDVEMRLNCAGTHPHTNLKPTLEPHCRWSKSACCGCRLWFVDKSF